jgi:DNA invertase Pin-like site-specific DNA recombinase
LREDLSITDEGKSAFKADNLKTGGLGRLLEEMKAGKIRAQHVIVEDVDRLTRQGFDPAYMMLKEFVAAGVAVDIIDKIIIGPDFTKDPLKIVGILFSATNAFDESNKKSGRCGKAWREKRDSPSGTGTSLYSSYCSSTHRQHSSVPSGGQKYGFPVSGLISSDIPLCTGDPKN